DGAVQNPNGLVESLHALVHPCLTKEDIYVPHIDQLRPSQPMKGILIMALLEGDLRKPEIEIDLHGVSFEHLDEVGLGFGQIPPKKNIHPLIQFLLEGFPLSSLAGFQIVLDG